MKILNKKFWVLGSMCLFTALSLAAKDFLAIAKNGNVYDEANAKYITLNQNNEEVSVVPGMVFETSQHNPGWYMIEYSPGLHAFVPDQIVSSDFKPIQAGEYDIKNQSGHKLSVKNSGQDWTATVDGNVYQGLKSENILVFYDSNNKIAFSLVDIGNGPVAFTYDNAVTKFF